MLSKYKVGRRAEKRDGTITNILEDIDQRTEGIKSCCDDDSIGTVHFKNCFHHPSPVECYYQTATATHFLYRINC